MTVSETFDDYRRQYPDDDIPPEVFEQALQALRYFDEVHYWYVTPPKPHDSGSGDTA